MSLGLTLAVLGAAIATIAGVGSAIGVGIAGEAASVQLLYFRLFLEHRVFTEWLSLS